MEIFKFVELCDKTDLRDLGVACAIMQYMASNNKTIDDIVGADVDRCREIVEGVKWNKDVLGFLNECSTIIFDELENSGGENVNDCANCTKPQCDGCAEEESDDESEDDEDEPDEEHDEDNEYGEEMTENQYNYICRLAGNHDVAEEIFGEDFEDRSQEAASLMIKILKAAKTQ